ncbi:hypothetical protein MVEN_00434300 [Mycena venus]|uniref:F-box domain-containing protein n=1 Tax=Mycena venus TaxID=2733690 RepID=A0A8H7DB49_9AGAR|nr:hypothetical protein MVEN_00434300 [Mycena venus]
MDPTQFLLNHLPSTPTFESQVKTLIEASKANIARIESQIRDLERLRDRERGLIARLRMAIAPIHKLPAELLVEIFVLVQNHSTISMQYRKQRIRKLHALSQVCAYWRRVAHTTPQLWTGALGIELDKTPTADYVAGVKGWLERSAPLPIPVSLKARKGVEAGPLMDVMATTAHRWSNANFNLPSLAVLSRISSASLESLERITLESADAKNHAQTRPFLTAKRLCWVFLDTQRTTQVLMPWAQLTFIHVNDLSPLECLNTLVQCASVVSAVIETHTWPGFPDMSARQLTTLERLEDLNISFGSTSAGFIAPFFVCLALPALKRLRLELNIDHIWSSAEFTQFQLRSSNIEDLTIDTAFALSSGDLLAVLQHAPSLVELNLENCMACFDDSVVVGLQYSDMETIHLAPKLQVLGLTYAGTDFDEDALDTMIQSRWWTDEQLFALPSPPKVARWSLICIHCGDEEDNVSPQLKAKLEEYKSQGLDIEVY